MKKTIIAFVMGVALSLSTVAAYAAIEIDVETASDEEISAAIDTALASGDNQGIVDLLTSMAASDSPKLSAALTHAATVAPALMPTVITSFKTNTAVGAQKAASAMATVVVVLTQNGNANVVTSIQNANADLVALATSNAAETEPAGGEETTTNVQVNTEVTEITENPNQTSGE